MPAYRRGSAFDAQAIIIGNQKTIVAHGAAEASTDEQ